MLTYDPLTTVPPAECKAQPSTRVVTCPGCEKRFAAIVTFDSEHWALWVARSRMFRHMCMRAIERLGSPAINYDTRAIYCDHCNRVVIWTERNGVELTKPLVIASAAHVRDFLLRHPEAAGVDQA